MSKQLYQMLQISVKSRRLPLIRFRMVGRKLTVVCLS